MSRESMHHIEGDLCIILRESMHHMEEVYAS
jgi:hypothetical protein